MTSKVLAIEPSRDELEPQKPGSDVRQSIEFVVKNGSRPNLMKVSSSKNSLQMDKSDYVGSTITDNANTDTIHQQSSY